MANLPKYLQKIKVQYITTLNGINEKHECTLAEILSDEMSGVRQNVTALALLPLFNKDGSLFEAANNPSRFIKDFPVLMTLAYPHQWGEISPKAMQTANCPNLQKIIRTIPEGYQGDIKEISIKGVSNLSVKEDASEVQSYGEVIGEGSDIYSVISVNPKSPTKAKSSSKKPKLLTDEYLNIKIENEITIALNKAERKLGSDNLTNAAKKQITNILNMFEGIITEEQLDFVVNAIQQSLDENIPVETIEKNLKEISKKIEESLKGSSKDNRASTTFLMKLVSIAESKDTTEAKLEAVKEVLLKKSARYFKTNNGVLNSMLIKLGLIDAEIKKEGGINDKLDEIIGSNNALIDLLMEELRALNTSVAGLPTSEDNKNAISEALKDFAITLKRDLSQGKTDFLKEIRKELKDVPTVDTLRAIADDAIEKITGRNAVVNKVLSNMVVDRIIDEMGDISRLDESDLLKVEDSINSVVNSERFKAVVSGILDDKRLATTDDMIALAEIVNDRSDQLAESLDSLSGKLKDMATREDVRELIRVNKDGEYEGQFVDFLRKELDARGYATKKDLKAIQKSESEMLGVVSNLVDVVNKIKINSESSSSEGSDVSVSVSNEVNIEQMTQNITQTCQQAIQTALTLFTLTSVMSQHSVSNQIVLGGGLQPNYGAVVGLLPLIVGGGLIGNLGGGTVINNNEVNNLLQLVIKGLGLTPPATPDPNYDKLKKELDDLKKRQDEQMAEIKKLLEGLVPKKVEEKTDDTKKEDDKKKKDPSEKKIVPPKPVGKTKIVQGTIKHIAKLQQPKLPLRKRIGKFIIRRPLAAAAIGLGVGALAATGVGIGLAGGVASFLGAANMMFPTIAIGAGIGGGGMLAVGGIGGVISHLSKRGRKEKLYAKFLRKKALCDSMSDEIEAKHEAQVEREAKLQELREKQRNGNKLLKKMGVYRMAKKFNRHKLRKLRTGTRKLEREHASKVQDALDIKKKLNNLEDSNNKSIAMGGYLQQLRNKKAKINARLADPRIDEDTKEELKEDLADVIEDAEDIVGGISQLSDDYKTFDQEAEELINSVKTKKTSAMKDILTDIEARNSDRVLHSQDAPVFDDKEVQDYLAATSASKNKEEVEKANQFKQYYEELKKQNTIGALVRDGKISGAVANKLMSSDTVELEDTDVVDPSIFKELSDD